MADTTLAIPGVGAGSQGNIDVAQVNTSAVPPATVLRENVVIADPNNFVGQANVFGSGRLAVDDSDSSVMQRILLELQSIKFILSAMSGVEVPPIVEENELQ